MNNNQLRLIGPFRQLLTLGNLPPRGPLSDEQLQIVDNAGIIVNGGAIEVIGSYSELKSLASNIEPVTGVHTVMPGMVDAHTHICWAGSRAGDYALRLAGRTYGEIARQGGGIWSTVTHTRNAHPDELIAQTVSHATRMLLQGVTTIEVKSGYGLNSESELRLLECINTANRSSPAGLIPTCLAAHIKPADFTGSSREYLACIAREVLPKVKSRNLSRRVDIYVDEGAFSSEDARPYLADAKRMGFDLVLHADQFTPGGARLAIEAGALSADHLEAITDGDLKLLAASPVIPVALPGASLGLGTAFLPARKLLDAGASLAIASDWNPGSAPMGNILMQAAILGIYERLTMAETLAAITVRAAQALRLDDRGMLKPGMIADLVAFPCDDFREILYNQGGLLPDLVWRKGTRLKG